MRLKVPGLLKVLGTLSIGAIFYITLFGRELNFLRDQNGYNEKKLNRTSVVKTPPFKPRILCWILTNPGNLPKKTIYIKWTWGPLCDITLYMSSVEDPTFPTVGLNITAKENKSLNALKVTRAWKYIYSHYLDQADFFLKADDDTYVVVSNLRAFLRTKDPSVAEFYGRRFVLPKKQIIYMSGGGSLVLTREALRILVENVLAYNTSCIPHGAGEDWKICRCLQLAGAKPVDTRDENGKERFHSFNLGTHLAGTYPAWFYQYDVDGAVKGEDCCSEYPISFHYVRGEALLTIHYLLFYTKLAETELLL